MAANGKIPTGQLAALPKSWSNQDRQEYLTKSAYASLSRMIARAVAETGVNFQIYDAYAEGDRVTYDGAVWRSLIDANVWSPDELVHSWFREGSVAEGEEPAPEEPAPETPGATLWAPGLALGVGDRVEHNGVVYVVRQAHTTQAGWEPTNLPALFTPEES